jgi:glycosyltransferase involved in cell wall biosynthesis
MKISVFIPAYNASSHIETVIKRFPETLIPLLKNVYIINDGSTDSTGSVIENLAKVNTHIIPVHFQTNRGYGNAVRAGLKRCRADGCEYAVCVHSDEQYPPEVIEEFVEKMNKQGIDILQGSRIASGTALSGGMPLYKFIAGRLLTILENIILRCKLTDYHSGMLFYSRCALSTIDFDRLSPSFDFDLEVLAAAKTCGLHITEQPIPTRYATEKSYLNPVTYGMRVLRVLFRYMTGYYKNSINKKTIDE